VANQPGLEDVFADLLEYEGGAGQEGEQQGGGGGAVDGIERDVGAEFYVAPTPEHLQGEGGGVVCVRRCFRGWPGWLV
jgi:hypothetical protein